jgi:hypothetical protein
MAALQRNRALKGRAGGDTLTWGKLLVPSVEFWI